MENYRKARTVEQPSVCPFTGLPANTPEIRVKDGSKIRNLLRFALNRMEMKSRGSEGEKETEEERPKAEEGEEEGRRGAAARTFCKQIIFTATGKAVSKAITCAEIVKRRVKRLYQLNSLQYATVVEVWEPLEPTAGLDSLTVSRNLPAIWILLSKEPLDRKQAGYQAPGRYDALWAQPAGREEGAGSAGQRAGHKSKKAGGGRRGGGPQGPSGWSREAGQT